MSAFFSKIKVQPTSKVQMYPVAKKAGDNRSLEERFADAKKAIFHKERRKLRDFHFIYLEHNGLLYALRGPNMIIMAKLEKPEDRKTLQAAREICWEYWSKFEEFEGGIYHDIFLKFKDEDEESL